MSNAADKAYELIRRNILEGVFLPDARLKEADLVEVCGVSRTPVREALRRLEAEDFVHIQRNQGAQVKSWSEDDLDDLFELRGLLEGYAAGRAAKRADAQDIQAIQLAIDEMDQVLVSEMPGARKTEEFLRLNKLVHERVWAAADSVRLISLLSRLVDQALVVHTARQFSIDRVAQSHAQHKELLLALEQGDATWADATMRSHIHAARRSLKEREGLVARQA